MIVGVHHVAINVRDFDRMFRFYKEGLGFEPVFDDYSWKDAPQYDHIIDVPNSAARSVLLKGGTCYLELFQYANPEPQVTQPLRPFDRGYTHFSVETNDMEKDFAHLTRCGMTFNGREPGELAGIKNIYGYDPEGNIIELIQCKPDTPIRVGALRA